MTVRRCQILAVTLSRRTPQKIYRRNSIQKLKRNINISFRVTPEERDIIQKSQEKAGFHNIRSFVFKLITNGYVVNLDLSDVRECSRLLRNVSNNINQIAKQANTSGNVYATELDEIKNLLGDIWQNQDKIIRSLTKILEVV